jgi:site-specific DNA-methyltransferase (adenine-specific)
MSKKKPAPKNRTIFLSKSEIKEYSRTLITLHQKSTADSLLNKTINQDLFEILDLLPDKFIDLLFIDPPYNMNKDFGSVKFREMKADRYSEWIDSFISKLVRCLKPNASIYFCGDWRSSSSIQNVLQKYFIVRNRITWEREKGRGSKINWKNNSEDIWYCTNSDKPVFNADSVLLKRRVLAPYRLENGYPKDWVETKKGGFRLTYPSNIWTDISVPFWSMSENTVHPTQKPEKLLAKIILASSEENQVIFDPFLGSGTTSVAAKKLKRKYIGVEIEKEYACLAEKRLKMAEIDDSIQGFSDGVFWERNTFSGQPPKNRSK